ncbi:tripartite tricarboxylate transporter TctB family protein [Bacillus sp. ISL-47]|uniref:tripartite tricarboxylate transporter TctB family protein n=1 Tax=Bacillus sp. ISL-47 TaxID=2819130 RepID=UPI001BE556D3|nr:tripartite tricarboxylate transporter TctB family protein [Bacillus sp. ISL-47]MBT2689845.1 tripartite tricarboxylate transporter TctB family protein [Bacillus sp. ISL-47]MBT2710222.1 tripartite tricarboxylate transporter TctB family protein [Pseudomonas sp. ISL-84]
MRRANIISSFIAIFIAGLFFIMTTQFKEISVQDTGPAFMPNLYAGVLVILALLLIINSAKKSDDTENGSKSSIKLVFVTMLLIIVLTFLIPILGFYIITPIAVFCFLKIFKEKKLSILFGLPIGIVLFVFILFQKLLLVPIPSGIIFQ